jgi:hypothetical protein
VTVGVGIVGEPGHAGAVGVHHVYLIVAVAVGVERDLCAWMSLVRIQSPRPKALRTSSSPSDQFLNAWKQIRVEPLCDAPWGPTCRPCSSWPSLRLVMVCRRQVGTDFWTISDFASYSLAQTQDSSG